MPQIIHSGNVPLPFDKVRINDRFWLPRIQTNAAETLYTQFRHLNDTGRLPAFKLDWKPGDGPVPHQFWDSDVAKWVEAACFSVCANPDPGMAAMIDEAVDLIVSSQQPDGYLNTHFSAVEPEQRWTNLRDMHELYCAGHLIEAAVAHYIATGSRKMLDAMCRYADYIDSVFGLEPGKKRGYCGHPEIELALVKLYEATGSERYLKLSEYFLEQRGQQPHYFDVEAAERGEQTDSPTADRYSYAQADVPIRQQTRVAGHAVRAMYLYSGAADVAGINHDSALFAVLKGLLEGLVTTRMYITGGLGPSARNEGFTADYDLPNRTAYAETCAAIGLVFWCHRMLRHDLDSRHADVMERALYNGALSGISLDGSRYFYQNPLASDGSHHRVDWFGCSCCPPNSSRLIASVGGYAYSRAGKDLIVHLYVQSETEFESGGQNVKVRQETDCPWTGDVAIALEASRPSRFGIRLRVPGWCDSFTASVNGEPVGRLAAEKGYLTIDREWKDADRIEISFPMPVKRVYAHPEVRHDAGMVALQRGPLVYCLEEVDNPVRAHRICLPDDASLEAAYEPELLGGVVTVRADALCLVDEGWEGVLYRDSPPRYEPFRITAVPYYAWDNRDPGWMNVWLRSAGGSIEQFPRGSNVSS
jgi:uncharacterized protein